MEARDSFGYWVRRRRKSLDLTQDELARRVGCAPVTLRKIEADERRPSAQMAERLALGLALPSSEWPQFMAAASGSETVAWLERPPSTQMRSSGNLPAPVTSLIGRESELATIAECIHREDVRLLTLTGPVGVGKTRLAIEAGRQLQTEGHGVYLVELAPVREPGLVLSAVATIFGVREGRRGNLAQLLADFLVDRRLLLILDNFEHLLAAAAEAAALLAACPNLKLMVTSRARLHLYGEHELVVPPLPLPAADDLVGAGKSTAVRLFCVRAQAARADFYLTPSLTATVAEICRHLDGLPLAIELAAARIRIFSPQELLQRLTHQPTPSPRAAAADMLQLRVLDKAITWSYDLLSPVQQRLLARLAIFAGGFGVEAAQAVCCEPGVWPDAVDIADDINALLDQSLLARETTPTPLPAGGTQCSHCPVQQLQEDATAELRFVMLETIKEFALAHLQTSNELSRLSDRHADYYAECVAQKMHQLHGPTQGNALAWLERNNDNLRAALRWLFNTGQIERAATMCCAMAFFWQRHGHYDEGRSWIERVLVSMAQHPVPDTVRIRTLHMAALLAYRQGDWHAAQPWLAECDAAYRATDDLARQAQVRFDQGWIAIDQGRWAAAVCLNQESLELARAAADDLQSYKALTNLGWTHLCTGDISAAEPLFNEAHTLAQQLQHTKGIAVSLLNLGWTAHYTGDILHAQSLAKRSLRISCRLDERELMAECFELLASATVTAGVLKSAATLSGAAHALRDALHIMRPTTHHAAVALAAADTCMRQQMGADDFHAAWALGHTQRIDTMVVFALGCNRNALNHPV